MTTAAALPPNFMSATTVPRVSPVGMSMSRVSDHRQSPAPDGMTPLMLACQQSREEEVKTLLKRKPKQATARDRSGKTALHYCAENQDLNCIDQLVSYEPSLLNIQDEEGYTALHLAVISALHCAASRGHVDCLETLISLCGAEVDVMDANGCTALFYAVTLGHADCSHALLKFGAEPNRQDRKGRTPAHCGAAKGQLETLKILSKHQANLWLRNVRGDLPLHEAVQSGRKDLVTWLLAQRPEAVNAPNSDGRCPLHIAAINNNVEMCKVLLDMKAHVNPIMRNSRGHFLTPLDAALHRGNRGCAKYLQLHGGVPAARISDKNALQRALLNALSESEVLSSALRPSPSPVEEGVQTDKELSVSKRRGKWEDVGVGDGRISGSEEGEEGFIHGGGTDSAASVRAEAHIPSSIETITPSPLPPGKDIGGGYGVQPSIGSSNGGKDSGFSDTLALMGPSEHRSPVEEGDSSSGEGRSEDEKMKFRRTDGNGISAPDIEKAELMKRENGGGEVSSSSSERKKSKMKAGVGESSSPSEEGKEEKKKPRRRILKGADSRLSGDQDGDVEDEDGEEEEEEGDDEEDIEGGEEVEGPTKLKKNEDGAENSGITKKKKSTKANGSKRPSSGKNVNGRPRLKTPNKARLFDRNQRRSATHRKSSKDSGDQIHTKVSRKIRKMPPLTRIPITPEATAPRASARYELERRIFAELLELKRLQIRSGSVNEKLLVKRLVDAYKKEGLVGLKTYEGPYNFASFEKYLYESLKSIQTSSLFKAIREKEESKIDPRDESWANSDKQVVMAAAEKAKKSKSRTCHHAAHAYTGIPIRKIAPENMPQVYNLISSRNGILTEQDWKCLISWTSFKMP
ncbi:unnamed protein product [Cyprideis torosa]|uniref:Uncharacterized protein n=1 Tax=Cyprideis torosa TaxID=163714 RepID=A0A7R8W515_9CRUS|nr:unnamed protein product [Cyprideis torosa]CAG0880106.1 unnamed protein product [Cyprideis torosa]